MAHPDRLTVVFSCYQSVQENCLIPFLFMSFRVHHLQLGCDSQPLVFWISLVFGRKARNHIIAKKRLSFSRRSTFTIGPVNTSLFG